VGNQGAAVHRHSPDRLNSAGHYIARVIPLDHCAFLDTNTVSRPYLSLGPNLP